MYIYIHIYIYIYISTYQQVLTIRKPAKKDFRTAKTSFKDCFRNQTRDFRHKNYVNSTEISKYMWKLKDEKITASIKWNIMSIIHATPKGGVCKLCLTEKFCFLNIY